MALTRPPRSRSCWLGCFCNVARVGRDKPAAELCTRPPVSTTDNTTEGTRSEIAPLALASAYLLTPSSPQLAPFCSHSCLPRTPAARPPHWLIAETRAFHRKFPTEAAPAACTRCSRRAPRSAILHRRPFVPRSCSSPSAAHWRRSSRPSRQQAASLLLCRPAQSPLLVPPIFFKHAFLPRLT
jgi:hypothetical protein